VLTAEERDRLRVVLVRSRNPLNIGAVARAMANFGFRHLRVVRPYDVAFREARSAVDAEPVLHAAEEFLSVAGAVADSQLVVGTAEGRGRNTQLQRLEAVAEEMRESLQAGANVAVLLGSEKTGLSNQDLSRCQRVLRIPTETAQPSMNLGQAAAVVLYELVRQREPEPLPEAASLLASAGDRERLAVLVTEMVERTTGDRQASGPPAEERVRRLIHPMALTEADAHGWMGVVRHVLWKLRGGN